MGPEVDPDTRDFAVDDQGLAKVAKWLGKVMPSVASKPEHAETCLYTMTKDHHFIIDLAPGSRRIVIGAGFSGHGFKMAPLVGSLLADIAMEGRVETVADTRGVDLSHFNIRRVMGEAAAKL
jgi:sarcosine oxidase / L-pipecolate oxidase